MSSHHHHHHHQNISGTALGIALLAAITAPITVKLTEKKMNKWISDRAKELQDEQEQQKNSHKYNIFGYDKDGYDRSGFNMSGYDRNGYDRDGYNQSGYNRDGYDRNGFNKKGFNKDGFDKCGNNFSYYYSQLSQVDEKIKSSMKQMKQNEFAYALHDIRIGLEKGVKCAIEHNLGYGYCQQKLASNIKICEDYSVFDFDFINKLHSARMHCNDMQHDSETNKTYNQVFFCYKVLEELHSRIKCYLD